MDKKSFPVFWYESNQTWGRVRSVFELKEKIHLQTQKTYGQFKTVDEFLDNSFQHKGGNHNFGTRMEHTGKQTLRQFLESNDFDFSQLGL